MKKICLIGIGALMLGTVGCTYNDVYYNSQTTHYHPERKPIPIMFRHEGYPQTYHLPRAADCMTHRRIPIDDSCSRRRFVRHVCPYCHREFIPPYHQNHICPKRNDCHHRRCRVHDYDCSCR